MKLEEIKKKVEEARNVSKKRNFTQTFDLIFNLQNLDLRQPSNKVDLGVVIDTHIKNKTLKIVAIIDHSITDAEKIFDKVIYNDELANLKGDMSKIRKLTQNYDKFVVQANYMPLFAQILGRYLGPLGKMPSPKLGMIINSKTKLDELYEKLQKTVHLQTRKGLFIQVSIGSEANDDETIAKNLLHVYESLVHTLPNHQNNLKEIFLKLTMGRRVRFK